LKETNITKYGLREEEDEYYTNITKSAAETTVDYWDLYESSVYYLLRFESYLETINLEINDIVKIDLASLIIEWHIPSGLPGALTPRMPFTRFHDVSAADDTIIGASINGLIKEMTVNFEQGTISYTVWIPRLLGVKVP